MKKTNKKEFFEYLDRAINPKYDLDISSKKRQSDDCMETQTHKRIHENDAGKPNLRPQE